MIIYGSLSVLLSLLLTVNANRSCNKHLYFSLFLLFWGNELRNSSMFDFNMHEQIKQTEIVLGYPIAICNIFSSHWSSRVELEVFFINICAVGVIIVTQNRLVLDSNFMVIVFSSVLFFVHTYLMFDALIDSLHSYTVITVIESHELNILLANTLNSIHPACLMVGVMATIVAILLNQPKVLQNMTKTMRSKKIYLRSYNDECILRITIVALILGAWWAQQEGTWAGWWGWEVSEMQLAILVTYAGMRVHQTQRLLSRFYYALCVIFMMSMYLLIQQNFKAASHNFEKLSIKDSGLVTQLEYKICKFFCFVWFWSILQKNNVEFVVAVKCVCANAHIKKDNFLAKPQYMFLAQIISVIILFTFIPFVWKYNFEISINTLKLIWYTLTFMFVCLLIIDRRAVGQHAIMYAGAVFYFVPTLNYELSPSISSAKSNTWRELKFIAHWTLTMMIIYAFTSNLGLSAQQNLFYWCFAPSNLISVNIKYPWFAFQNSNSILIYNDVQHFMGKCITNGAWNSLGKIDFIFSFVTNAINVKYVYTQQTMQSYIILMFVTSAVLIWIIFRNKGIYCSAKN